MSARLLGLAFDAETASQSAKLVLIKLVDCCDDDGRNIFPAVATIAKAAQCSSRTVQRVLGEFCEIGLLRRVRAGGSGPRSTASYEMNVDLLFRLGRDGWAAVAGNAVAVSPEDGEAFGEPNDAEVSDGHDDVCGDAPKGDMVSPLAPERMTPATAKGDMMCHPTPQTNPQDRERGRVGTGAGASERQRAHGSGSFDRTDGQADPDAGAPEGCPPFAEFQRAWPTSAADDRVQVANLWAALPFDERRRAVDHIPAYLAFLKSIRRDAVPAGQRYLRDRPWTLIAEKALAAPAVAPATAQVKNYTREWWAVLLQRVRRGQRVTLMLAFAEEGRATGFGQPQAEMPDAATVEAHRPFPSDGEVYKRWCVWADARGARLPSWRDRHWVFLPGEDPAAYEAASDDRSGHG